MHECFLSTFQRFTSFHHIFHGFTALVQWHSCIRMRVCVCVCKHVCLGVMDEWMDVRPNKNEPSLHCLPWPVCMFLFKGSQSVEIQFD